MSGWKDFSVGTKTTSRKRRASQITHMPDFGFNFAERVQELQDLQLADFAFFILFSYYKLFWVIP